MLTVSQACKVQKLQKRATVSIGWPLNVPLCPPIPSLYLLNDLYQIISLKVCAFVCACACACVCAWSNAAAFLPQNVTSCLSRWLLSYYLWHSSAMQGHSHWNARSHQEETHSLALFLPRHLRSLSHSSEPIANAPTFTHISFLGLT